jgi:serine/threonine protein kinase
MSPNINTVDEIDDGLSRLAGRTLTVAVRMWGTSFESNPDDVQLTFALAKSVLAKGAQATVFEILDPGWEPRIWQLLGTPPGTPLVCRAITEAEYLTKKRAAALTAISKIRASKPAATLGLVPVLALGHPMGPEFALFRVTVEIMPNAGVALAAAISSTGGEAAWNLREAEVLAAMKPAADSLALIHTIGSNDTGFGAVTGHRDIKPQNLIVLWNTDPGFQEALATAKVLGGPLHNLPLVRIADMGGLYTRSYDPKDTRTAQRRATAGWSAPEYFDDVGVVTDIKAADVWSFGATLFFALTGEHPWTAITEARYNVSEAQFRRITEAREDSDAFARLSPEVAELLHRCFYKFPETRPSMSEITAVLDEIIKANREFAEADITTGPIPLIPVPTAESTEIRNEPPAQPRRMIRSRLKASLVSVALAATLLMMGMLFSSPPNNPGSQATTSEAASTTPDSAASPAPQPKQTFNPGGWGPQRPTYTMASPAPTPVLNSITDRLGSNGTPGDERYSVSVWREGSIRGEGLLRANIGDVLRVGGYFFNDAAPGPEADIKGLSVRYSTETNTTQIPVWLIVKGVNADEVWDSASIITTTSASLEIVPGSFHMRTNKTGSDFVPLPDGEFSKGSFALVGRTSEEAVLPPAGNGGWEAATFIGFKVKVVEAKVELQP